MTGRFVLATVLLAAASLSAQAQTVKVEFLMGKVNLVAQNATLRAILTEWSRVGGTRLINPERLTGGPVTLEFTGIPERQALDILLREIGGYMLGPRPALVAGVSAFDRLVVVSATAGRPTPPAPAFAPPRPTPQIGRAAPIPLPEPDEDSDDDEDEDDEEEPAPPPAVRQRPGGMPTAPALPPLPAQQEAPAPAVRPSPGNPFGAIQGSSTPGTIAAPSPRLPGESDSERILRDSQGQQGR